MTTSFGNALGGSPATDGALTAPAAARNRDPILAVLRDVLPKAGTVLEIASGTGEHAGYKGDPAAETDRRPGTD